MSNARGNATTLVAVVGGVLVARVGIRALAGAVNVAWDEMLYRTLHAVEVKGR